MCSGKVSCWLVRCCLCGRRMVLVICCSLVVILWNFVCGRWCGWCLCVSWCCIG